MKNWLWVVLAMAVLGACASTPPDDTANACEIFDDKGGWYKATAKAEKRHGLPKSIQLAIIGQESGFDADAKPSRRRFLFVFPGKRRSSARGYPQAVEATWDLYKRETGNRSASRKSFSDAADFVSWYAQQSNRRLGIPLYDGYRQYLAYHEGWGGYAEKTYRKKSELRGIARGVDAQADRYAAQLKRCEKRFKRGIPLIPFI